MYYEVCNCTTLPYRELWECKKNIKQRSVQLKLRDLANPSCKHCKGAGKFQV